MLKLMSYVVGIDTIVSCVGPGTIQPQTFDHLSRALGVGSVESCNARSVHRSPGVASLLYSSAMRCFSTAQLLVAASADCYFFAAGVACSLPHQGTLKVEVSLASGVSGVVTRDAKGSGQGTLTITDGNNLEMPADVKFPKARETEGRRGRLWSVRLLPS